MLHILQDQAASKYGAYMTKHNVVYTNNQAARRSFRDTQILFPLLPTLLPNKYTKFNSPSQFSQIISKKKIDNKLFLKKHFILSNLNYFFFKRSVYYKYLTVTKHFNLINKRKIYKIYNSYLSTWKTNKLKNKIKKVQFLFSNRRFKKYIHNKNRRSKSKGYLFNKYKKAIHLIHKNKNFGLTYNKKVNKFSTFNTNSYLNIKRQFMRTGIRRYIYKESLPALRFKVSSFFLNKYLQRIKFKFVSSLYHKLLKNKIIHRLYRSISYHRYVMLFDVDFICPCLYLIPNIIFFIFSISLCALYLSYLYLYINIQFLILTIINLYENRKHCSTKSHRVLNGYNNNLSNSLDSMSLVLWHLIFKNIFFYSIINQFMKSGKKEKMECIFFDILTILKRKLRVQPMVFTFKLFNSLIPVFDIYHIRRYRKMHPIPRLLKLRRKLFVLFFMLKQVLSEKKKIWYFRNRFVTELIKTNFKRSSIFFKILNLQRFAYNVRRNLYFTRKIKRKAKVFI